MIVIIFGSILAAIAGVWLHNTLARWER